MRDAGYANIKQMRQCKKMQIATLDLFLKCVSDQGGLQIRYKTENNSLTFYYCRLYHKNSNCLFWRFYVGQTWKIQLIESISSYIRKTFTFVL